jgi:UDP-N-acetyl-D-galactosamine dehydrogenase
MESLYQRIIGKKESISLVGLGYVGMPIAVAFAKKGVHVIGYTGMRRRSRCIKAV